MPNLVHQKPLELLSGGKHPINSLSNPIYHLSVIAPSESGIKVVKINLTHIADKLFEFSRVNIVHMLPTTPLLMRTHNTVEILSNGQALRHYPKNLGLEHPPLLILSTRVHSRQKVLQYASR